MVKFTRIYETNDPVDLRKLLKFLSFMRVDYIVNVDGNGVECNFKNQEEQEDFDYVFNARLNEGWLKFDSQVTRYSKPKVSESEEKVDKTIENLPKLY